MDFLKGLFSPHVVNKTVDGIYNGVDKMFYTDEEKAEAQQRQADTKLKLLPLFEPFKLAQRFIAIIITVNFFLAFWVGVAILLIGTEELLSNYLGLVVGFEIGWIMLTVVAWFFTGGVVNSFKTQKDK